MKINELIENLGENEAKVLESTDSFVTVMVKIPLSKNMLHAEENIQKGLNEVGKLATSCALSQFDTDGSPIEVAKISHTSKGLTPKYYQTPYGDVYIQRHVYQNSTGGAIYCPLERDAAIIGGTTTPLFAKMVSSKYSQMSARAVQRDFLNHSRKIACCYIQEINDAIGKIVVSRPNWTYAIPVETSNVASIGISLDGTCIFISGEGYRQAMVGSISLYDCDGERLYSRYTSMSPEYGNWSFLKEHVNIQILDYFHATEYLSSASKAAFNRPFEEKEWFETAKHRLKYEKKGAENLINEMKLLLKKRISKAKKDKIESAITYFTNHLHQMNYPQHKKDNIPIGSGVIEAACKVIVKQRLCHSGMKWKDEGAKTVLTLRCLHESPTIWEQFWRKATYIK
jgi:hypothetical protein